MTSIGETLRRERMRRKLELSQISRELKISSRMLEAIEAERFDKLPGGVFAKSFVRQYAHLLGLDEEELATQVQRMLEPQPPPDLPNGRERVPASLSINVPLPSSNIHVPPMETWESVGDRRSSWGSWLPALVMVVVVMLLCSGVYSWWQHGKRPSLARAQAPAATESAVAPAPIPAPVPSETVTPPATPAAQNPQPQPASSVPANSATGSVSSAARSATGAVEPPPVVRDAATQPAAAAPGSNPNGAAPAPNPNAAVRVELTAEEPVWVLARSDGKFSFSGTLNPNETRTVEANEKIVLRIGNAGGVNVVLNGKPIGTVGPKGQVREVQLTSGGFQIVAVPVKPLIDPLL